MHSEPRRPDPINLDRFVESLDERLRGEVTRVRRVVLPPRIRRFMRAVKVRALALAQGGALALTAFAVIVAVGLAPSIRGAQPTEDSILAAPDVKPRSMVIHKANTIEFAPNSRTVLAAEERGLYR